MPRVKTIEKARASKKSRTCRTCGKKIKVGDKYYTYSFRYGGTYEHCADHYPKPSQLTNSPFYQSLYDIQDRRDGCGDPQQAKDEIGSIISDLESLRDETQEKFDNMPEGLQQGDTGQLLEERVSRLEEAISEFEEIQSEFEEDEVEEVDEPEEPTEPDREDFEEGEVGDEEYEAAKTEYENELSEYNEKLEAFEEWEKYESELEEQFENFNNVDLSIE